MGARRGPRRRISRIMSVRPALYFSIMKRLFLTMCKPILVITILQTFCDVYAAATPTAGPKPTSTKPFFKATGTASSGGDGDGNGGAFNMGSFGFGGNGGGGGATSTTTPGGGPDLGASSAVVVTVTQTPGPNGNAAARGTQGSRWGLFGVFVGALLIGF